MDLTTEKVSSAELSSLLGITDSRLRQLVRSGDIPRAERGKFVLAAGVSGYLNFLKSDERKSGKSAAENRVRNARAAEIELRMAREDRKLIDIDEALTVLDDISGAMLQLIGGLPAQITRDGRERQRIELICDGERGRLANKFAQMLKNFETGTDDAAENVEDDE